MQRICHGDGEAALTTKQAAKCRAINSAARVLRLHRRSQGFESLIAHYSRQCDIASRSSTGAALGACGTALIHGDSMTIPFLIRSIELFGVNNGGRDCRSVKAATSTAGEIFGSVGPSRLTRQGAA